MSDVFQKYDGENSESRAVDYLQSQVSATSFIDKFEFP